MEQDPLALSHLLHDFQSAHSVPLRLDADDDRVALAATTAQALSINPRARQIDAFLRTNVHQTRLSGDVVQLDDAIEYLDIVITPPLLPRGCADLKAAVRFYEDAKDMEGRVQPVLWSRIRNVLQVARTEALDAEAATRLSALQPYVADARRFAFPGRRRPRPQDADAAFSLQTARHRLRNALAHGLIYGVDPEDLIAARTPDRIGHLGAVARDRLAGYDRAMSQSGTTKRSRGVERLLAAANLDDRQTPSR